MEDYAQMVMPPHNGHTLDNEGNPIGFPALLQEFLKSENIWEDFLEVYLPYDQPFSLPFWWSILPNQTIHPRRYLNRALPYSKFWHIGVDSRWQDFLDELERMLEEQDKALAMEETK